MRSAPGLNLTWHWLVFASGIYLSCKSIYCRLKSRSRNQAQHTYHTSWDLHFSFAWSFDTVVSPERFISPLSHIKTYWFLSFTYDDKLTKKQKGRGKKLFGPQFQISRLLIRSTVSRARPGGGGKILIKVDWLHELSRRLESRTTASISAEFLIISLFPFSFLLFPLLFFGFSFCGVNLPFQLDAGAYRKWF